MKFIKNLEKSFVLLMIIALGYLSFSWYQRNSFKNNPISSQTQNKIKEAQYEVLLLIDKYFKLRPSIELIVSDEFHSNLYGLTSYKDKTIKIYLNKKRFKESETYMIEEVIPHEYAHAMLFVLGEKVFDDGHSKKWQQICFKLGGKQCVRYVDNEEVVRQKMAF